MDKWRFEEVRVTQEAIKAHKAWIWWHEPIIPVLGLLRQEDLKWKTSLSYIAKSCLYNNQGPGW